MDVFELKDLNAGYPGKKVLNSVDLKINSAEFISIIGPNGAGKSTLLKTFSGSIIPESGDIFFLGRRMSDYTKRELAACRSVVEQFSALSLSFTVFDYVMLGRFPHQKFWEVEKKLDIDEVEKAFAETKSGYLRDRFITELSGGELQLVQIARAFAQNSRIIILDEPVSHLDINHTMQIMDLLYSLNLTGSTIISVIHDINLASEYSSRIIGLKEGSIFFDGSPAEVINAKAVKNLFDTNCDIYNSPLSGKPFVYPFPGHLRK